MRPAQAQPPAGGRASCSEAQRRASKSSARAVFVGEDRGKVASQCQLELLAGREGEHRAGKPTDSQRVGLSATTKSVGLAASRAPLQGPAGARRRGARGARARDRFAGSGAALNLEGSGHQATREVEQLGRSGRVERSRAERAGRPPPGQVRQLAPWPVRAATRRLVGRGGAAAKRKLATRCVTSAGAAASRPCPPTNAAAGPA